MENLLHRQRLQVLSGLTPHLAKNVCGGNETARCPMQQSKGCSYGFYFESRERFSVKPANYPKGREMHCVRLPQCKQVNHDCLGGAAADAEPARLCWMAMVSGSQ